MVIPFTQLKTYILLNIPGCAVFCILDCLIKTICYAAVPMTEQLPESSV